MPATSSNTTREVLAITQEAINSMNSRVSLLDDKMDKLIDTMATLARIEEKVFSQQQSIARVFSRLSKDEKLLNNHTVCATKMNLQIKGNASSIQTLYRGIAFIACVFTTSAIGIFMAWMFKVPPIG